MLTILKIHVASKVEVNALSKIVRNHNEKKKKLNPCGQTYSFAAIDIDKSFIKYNKSIII